MAESRRSLDADRSLHSSIGSIGSIGSTSGPGCAAGGRDRFSAVFCVLVLFGLSALGGCTFSSTLDSASCDSDADCAGGAVCQSGFCVQGSEKACPDEDDDGFSPFEGCGDRVDCDDSDPEVAPGLDETCDGKDNDCDGEVDEGVEETFYRDADRDGYGTEDDTATGCSPPPGYVRESGDCDEEDPAVHPGAEEVCNGVDDDCDGMVDNVPREPSGDGDTGPSVTDTGSSVSDADVSPFDADVSGLDSSSDTSDADVSGGDADSSESDAADASDGSSSGGSKTDCGRCGIDCTQLWDHASEVACARGTCELLECEQPHFDLDGESANGCEYECNYLAETGGPVKDEDSVCDDLDEDCDGTIDEDFSEYETKGTTCSEGTGACETTGQLVCADSGEALECSAEPKQEDAEVCNGIDDDCDGKVDNDPEPSSDTTTYYRDEDEDGYGDASETREFCDDDTPPDNWASNPGDCDHGDRNIYPGAPEQCDGEDNDCDDEVDEASECICEYGATREIGQDEGACETGTEKCEGTKWVTVEEPVEPSVETCDDLDNDCDGIVNDIHRCGDCDPGKWQYCGEDDTNWGSCQSTMGATESKCSDGIDNDCDGDIDSEDSDCP